MYTVSDLKKGAKVEIDGVPYVITEYNFVKPGKGQAVYTCRLKNMLTGYTMVKNYRSGDKFDTPHIEEKSMHFSYQEGDNYIFIDDNYEQISISGEVLGEARLLLVEDIAVEALFHNHKPIGVTLPTFVEKTVVETEPGARGNTATNVLKAAKVEGGMVVQVPLFVERGDVIKIDTRTFEYADRVAKR